MNDAVRRLRVGSVTEGTSFEIKSFVNGSIACAKLP